LSAITADDFPDIYFWFLFWHGLHTFLTRRYLTQWSKGAQEVSLFCVISVSILVTSEWRPEMRDS
jgi:hypothetical protein